jgi:hypothetical protein
VRAIPHFARALRSRRTLDDVRRLQLVAGDLLDRFVEARLVVGHVDRDRRRTARHDAEHVAVVHELLRDALEEVADASGVVELEMKVVNEEEKDATRHVVARARRRQDDPLGRRRRRRREHVVDAAAHDHGHRHDVLLDAVFEDFEIVLLQVGHEVALVVAHDHVVGDEIDLNAERRFLLRRLVGFQRHVDLRRQSGREDH